MRGCPSKEELAAFYEGCCTRQRSHILQHHVSRCTHCTEWMAELAANEEVLSAHTPWSDHTPFHGNGPSSPSSSSTVSGETATAINGYFLEEELGRGGQGIVYRATEFRTAKEVAIKIIRDGPFSSWSDRTRFEREIEVLRRMNHPNIVMIHESGRINGSFYYVMDYVIGKPLDVYVSEAQLTFREVLELILKVCETADAAHMCGIVHRDLKPSNIRVDENGQPHLLDFGLAKMVTGGYSEPLRPWVVSVTGQFTGSLAWASPEQANGAWSKLDVRTDVYSLGMILYQLVTGRFPYKVTGTMCEVLENITKAEPVDPRKGERPVDKELKAILLKCLDKSPENRYRNAGDLGREIGRYLQGAPIEARLHSSLYLLKKMADRHKVFAFLVTFHIVFTTGVLMLFMLLGIRR